ncbi:MAG: (E)-4-hydroxy-3-methylbut-2-enyl-diphosphate synthase [Bacteroidales bacterium]|nr:(E)-4-hydroxy-3-methylbut-2-enyl-diphosphate synthase [Bacteroidales bacterium]
MVFRTRIIKAGSLEIGGNLPVRIQSMTNTDTLDTASSVRQCIRIIEAGGELVRLTAQGIREAENLANIKRELRKAGFDTPLCADIHFNPSAAEVAARIVEKVRINPGNYADKRALFIRHELSESDYAAELDRIRDRLMPLIAICREHGTAVRIGVNHGSLSDRIMTRYGNTAMGMAVSAVEFLRIFRGEGFNNIVVSMKSSDTRVMVESNRMLVRMLSEEGMDYPVHLGITEAGVGEDGRIISAAGIGTLLAEGIGDTVRVSLSEAPEHEIPVAKEIIRFVCGNGGRVTVPSPPIEVATGGERYFPLVITENNGLFSDERGGLFDGEIFTFNAGELQYEEESELFNKILNPVFNEDDHARLSIDAAALLGRFFIARRPAGLAISNRGRVQGEALRSLAFAILQATEARITRTRYISCPTCGRTRFNLEEAVRKVKAATSHLTGMKIAVMGCVVNGPGEMAGSDYGYVGAAEGKVHIYRGTEAIMKNIPEDEALTRLLELIESDHARR